MRPRLLLADEPTGNLDSRSGAEVIDVLERLNQDGITLITVTHDQKLGDRARRHIRMVDGMIDRDQVGFSVTLENSDMPENRYELKNSHEPENSHQPTKSYQPTKSHQPAKSNDETT